MINAFSRGFQICVIKYNLKCKQFAKNFQEFQFKHCNQTKGREREKEKCVTEFGKLSNKLRIKLLRTNRMIELVEWNELPSLILYIETIYKHQNNRKKGVKLENKRKKRLDSFGEVRNFSLVAAVHE